MNARTGLIALIKAECESRKLDPVLICALIDAESGFDTYAMRYEPSVIRTFNAEVCAKKCRISLETEKKAQQFSFGLGQVLGSTARWLGFEGNLLSLCAPILGVRWCCTAFEKLGAKYKTKEEKIAAYNMGSVRRSASGAFLNQMYVDRVLKFYEANTYE